MKTIFSTSDLYLAAFVWSTQSATFTKLQPKSDTSKKGVFKFYFELDLSTEELNNLLLDYQNGVACVEPSTFVKKQGYLKDQIRLATNR